MEMSAAQLDRNGERERGKVEWIIGREGRKGDDEERKEMKGWRERLEEREGMGTRWEEGEIERMTRRKTGREEVWREMGREGR